MAGTLLVLRGRAQAESGTGTGGERRERTGDEALKGERRPHHGAPTGPQREVAGKGDPAVGKASEL